MVTRSSERRRDEIVPGADAQEHVSGRGWEKKDPLVTPATPLPSADVLGHQKTSISESFTGLLVPCSRLKSVEDDDDVVSKELDSATVVTETESYQCDYCRNTYGDKSSLRSHIVQVHHSLDHQKCPVCHKYFSNDDEEFQKHLQTHPKDKKFYCTVCEGCFSSRDGLRSHIFKSHASRDALVCSVCGNGFVSRTTLSCHHATAHDEADRKFKCLHRGCGKSFASRGSLRKHVGACAWKRKRKGGVVVSYACRVCGKVLSTGHNLKIHALVHARSGQHPCPRCPKRFVQLTARNLHVRLCHLKARPGEVGGRSAVKRRRPARSDARPYKCVVCLTAFEDRKAAIRHLQRVHGMLRGEVNVNIIFQSRDL